MLSALQAGAIVVALSCYILHVGQAADIYWKELAMSPEYSPYRPSGVEDRWRLLELLGQNIILLRQLINETQRHMDNAYHEHAAPLCSQESGAATPEPPSSNR